MKKLGDLFRWAADDISFKAMYLAQPFKKVAEDVTAGMLYPATNVNEYIHDKGPGAVAGGLLLSGLMLNGSKLIAGGLTLNSSGLITAGVVFGIYALDEFRQIGANARLISEHMPR